MGLYKCIKRCYQDIGEGSPRLIDFEQVVTIDESKLPEDAEAWEFFEPVGKRKAAPAPETEDEDEVNPEGAAIRDKAKKLGIRNWHNKSISRLQAEIEEMEA